MANRRDMRREDLIVPYIEPDNGKDASDMQGTLASTLPMAAIFTRNKMIGWTAVMFAVQNWLSETPSSKASSSTPGILSIGMAVLALGTSYMGLFLPSTPGQQQAAGTGTGAPTAAPLGS